MDDKEICKESLEFLGYVENSTDDTINNYKGNLVKTIHKRVQEVKMMFLWRWSICTY